MVPASPNFNCHLFTRAIPKGLPFGLCLYVLRVCNVHVLYLYSTCVRNASLRQKVTPRTFPSETERQVKRKNETSGIRHWLIRHWLPVDDVFFQHTKSEIRRSNIQNNNTHTLTGDVGTNMKVCDVRTTVLQA